ncbi:MAG TPA: hypothetical protein VM888_04905, partial [Chitinophagaceae bacterium]|nr:hypothetical protein [Chitinophagaceae bacterium]
MSEHLHIVCLDSPSPPDYGGAIDMYYKFKALHSIGKKITLHYFKYAVGRTADNLAPYCYEVYAYKRKKGLAGLSFTLPYIVSSRINQQLIDRLNEDDDPIILEGIHCTGIIRYIKNKGRKIVVRIHNNEAVYYKQLAKVEKNKAKQLYYKIESFLLNKYQKSLPPNCTYACLSTADVATFTEKYKKPASIFIPCFVAWDKLEIKQDIGIFCLYHGNMT